MHEIQKINHGLLEHIYDKIFFHFWLHLEWRENRKLYEEQLKTGKNSMSMFDF